MYLDANTTGDSSDTRSPLTRSQVSSPRLEQEITVLKARIKKLEARQREQQALISSLVSSLRRMG